MRPEAPLQWHDPEHVVKSLQRYYKIMRGNVSYGDSFDPNDVSRNIAGYPVTAVTPGVANTEFAVNHKLNKVPIGFHLVNKNGQTDVWKSTTAWTNKTVYFKASGININITLFLF